MARRSSPSRRRSPAGFLGGLALLSFSALASGTDAPPVRLEWPSVRWETGRAVAIDTTGATRELTLDGEFQEATRHLLHRAKAIAGAATLVDVATGQVLAAVEIGDHKHGSLLFDPVAPAASVFKIVTTVALYENSAVTPGTRVCTRGGIRSIQEEHLIPAQGGGVVCSPFAHALGVSRNAAYAQLAHRFLEPEDLLATAARLGFNRPRSSEAPGQLGSLELPTDNLHYARTAAGFENSKLSVLGGAELAMAVATGGLSRPLRFFAPRPGALPEAPQPPTRVMSMRSAERVRRSMEFTVHSGTAHEAFRDEEGKPFLGKVRVAGKTGTRQPHIGAPTASWFIGFAPSDHPRVAVSVVLQNSDLWHQKGHQLARDLLRVYFARMRATGVTSPLEATTQEAVRTASRN